MARAIATFGLLWITAAASVCSAGENLFKALAEAGAPVAAVESPGTTFGAGRPGLVNMLLAAGVSERWSEEASTGSSTPPEADQRLVRLLLKAVDDPDARFENGETVLIRAVRHGLEEGVELLLDKGADVHARDFRGHTPLWHAKRTGNPEIVKMLEAFEHKKADANLRLSQNQPATYSAKKRSAAADRATNAFATRQF